MTYRAVLWPIIVNTKLQIMKTIILGIFFFSFLVSCIQENNNNTMSPNNLAKKIDYKDTINNTVFFEGEAYKMILFAMKKEHTLKPHSAPMDTPLLILEGSAIITIGKEEHTLNKGDIITLPKEIDHGVYPVTDVKFLLIK